MEQRTSAARRALVLVGARGPRYEADVQLDGPWAHLTRVNERICSSYRQPRADRSIRASTIHEIRWASERVES
jgi:hypothetical protein